MGKGRAPCCDKTQVKRGPWSPEEDLKLITFIHKHGHENWRALPKLAGLVRCGKSCRLRWINYLRPDVKRGNFTIEEEETVIRLHKALGNKWSKIASHLPGRTDNEIKNVWNTHLKKRLPKQRESSATFSSDSLISSNGSEHNNNEEASPVTVAEKQVSDDELNGIIIPEDQKESPTSFSSFDSNLSNSSYIVNYEPEEQMGNSLLDELLEIPMESDYDIWNMLDNSESLIQSNLREEIGVEDDAEKRKWFNDLENELGLGAIDQENQDDAAEQVTKKSELLDSDMGLAFLESSWPSWP